MLSPARQSGAVARLELGGAGRRRRRQPGPAGAGLAVQVERAPGQHAEHLAAHAHDVGSIRRRR